MPPAAVPSAQQRLRAEQLLASLDLDPRHIGAMERSYMGEVPEYHGPKHCIWVANTFYDIAAGIVSDDDLRHGLLAALWHDASHPGDPDDSINTSISAAAYMDSGLEDAGIDPRRVCTLVLSTCNSRTEDRTGAERLLHDADLLQTVLGHPEHRRKWTDRLMSELGDAFQSDGSERSNLEYVEPRLLTVPGRRALERYGPGAEDPHEVAVAQQAAMRMQGSAR